MSGTPSIKKVLPNAPQIPNEKDGYISLKEKSKIELTDILEREEKLLKNKKILEKLPDKGAKMVKFCDQIKDELRRKDADEDLCGKLAELSVHDIKSALERREWTGECESEKEDCQIEENEHTDPLKILATHSGTDTSKKKILNRYVPTEELLRPSRNDVVQAENMESPNMDVYARARCDRFDVNIKQLPATHKFHPHRTLTHTSMKDPTAPSKNLPTQQINQLPNCNSETETCTSLVETLSLKESITIQHEQTKALKEAELFVAEERLRSGKLVANMKDLHFPLNEYRERDNSDSDEETSSTTNEEYEDAEDN